MPSVIQELTGEDVTLSRGHVLQRVEEWRTRLSHLYTAIRSWLPDYIIDDHDSVEMHEDLMRAYGVASIRLPILHVADELGEAASFVPRGLWIIGANGRVDLSARGGSFILFDRSDYYEAPRWEITPSARRLEVKSFSRDTLLDAIR